MNCVEEKLFSYKDDKYRDFIIRITPSVTQGRIIGVRIPNQRKIAKELFKSGKYEDFLNDVPHNYFEEDNIHTFIIEQIKDFDLCVSETDRFLPYIDNWATCDSFSPKVYKKNKAELLKYINKWIKSDKTYTVRYAIGLLMGLYLDEDFDEKYLDKVASIKSDEYYINMMIAWYFQAALLKQYDKAVVYLENNLLDTWVHNKAIQKALESRCIDFDTKNYLKSLKRR